MGPKHSDEHTNFEEHRSDSSTSGFISKMLRRRRAMAREGPVTEISDSYLHSLTIQRYCGNIAICMANSTSNKNKVSGCGCKLSKSSTPALPGSTLRYSINTATFSVVLLVMGGQFALCVKLKFKNNSPSLATSVIGPASCFEWSAKGQPDNQQVDSERKPPGSREG
jgi:hypothetical protein